MYNGYVENLGFEIGPQTGIAGRNITDRDAKFELAKAILDTRDALEASRNPKTQRYGIDPYSAADMSGRKRL